jgi:hypothetical protein
MTQAHIKHTVRTELKLPCRHTRTGQDNEPCILISELFKYMCGCRKQNAPDVTEGHIPELRLPFRPSLTLLLVSTAKNNGQFSLSRFLNAVC